MKIVIVADSSSASYDNSHKSYLEDIYSFCVSLYPDVFVVCPEDAILEISKIIPSRQIIIEPFSKGTATAIGIAAAYFAKENPKELITFIFANQHINNQNRLIATLRVAEAMYAQVNKLLLIGVAITGKTNDYGYVKLGRAVQEMSGVVAFEMLGFERNPAKEDLSKYLHSWQYLWDTGCMVITTEKLFEVFRETIPDLYTGLLTIQAAIGTKFEKEITNTVYKSFTKESVAKGLYEKIAPENVLVLPVDLGFKEYFQS